MDNVKKVIAGGCSFTAGSELADWDGTRSTVGILKPRSDFTWANWVQKRLYKNATVDNTAIPGLDYGACVRRVLYQTNKMLKSYKAEDIVVLIMWTSILRREFPRIKDISREKNQDHEDRFFTSLPSDGESITSSFAFNMSRKVLLERKQLISDEYLTRTLVEFYTRRATADNHIYYPLQQLEYLTSYLKSHNVKFYYTCAFNDLLSLKHHYPNIFFEDMKQRLDLNNLVHTENNLGFYEWAKKNDYKCGQGSDHPLESAHEKWAELFSKYILDKHKTT